MNNHVYSVTISFNPELELLKEQLLSLQSQVSQIILVDNCSSNYPDLKAMIENEDFNVILITLDSNKGLATAQNIGVNKAIESGAEYILLFDQDSVLDDDFTNGMLESYDELTEAGHKLGALGPVFYDPITNIDYPPTHYKGPFIIRDTPSELSPVTFLIASGCFFSVDIFKEIGPMNDELFVDYIDVDWSLRCKAEGYELFMTNKARMAHTIGDKRKKILGRTISVHSPIRRYFLIRNSFFMLRQSYVPVGYKIRELVFNVLRSIVGIMFSDDKMKVLKYIGKGLIDGFNNKFGPLE